MKPLSSFPPICDQIWQRILRGSLQRSDSHDPCSFAKTQFIDCPSRSECEALRYDLQNYRTAVGRHALDGRLDKEQRTELGIQHSRMVAFTIAPRNMLFPQFRRFGKPFYALADGPHRLYFAAKRDKHQFAVAQLGALSPAPTVRAPETAGSSILDELGYGLSSEEL